MLSDNVRSMNQVNGEDPTVTTSGRGAGAEQTARPGLGTKVFLALVIVGFAAAGIGAIKTYLDESRQSTELVERGVETDGDVMSATEISGRRIETYTKLRVSYDPQGPRILDFAEVQDCPAARYEPGISTVRVVYLPDDPDVIRLQTCRSSFDSDVLPGILGLVFIALALLILWRARRVWRRRPS